MSNKDLLPGDEANEPQKPGSGNQPTNHNEPEDLLRDQLYDKQDMLQMFKISSRTLQEWRSTGVLKFLKIKGKIIYPKIYVEEMMRKHRVG